LKDQSPTYRAKGFDVYISLHNDPSEKHASINQIPLTRLWLWFCRLPKRQIFSRARSSNCEYWAHQNTKPNGVCWAIIWTADYDIQAVDDAQNVVVIELQYFLPESFGILHRHQNIAKIWPTARLSFRIGRKFTLFGSSGENRRYQRTGLDSDVMERQWAKSRNRWIGKTALFFDDWTKGD